MFDITNRESFDNIGSWLQEINTQLGEDVKIMVFANKSDITEESEIQVTEDDIKQFIQSTGIPVIRTSARTG